MLMSKYNCFYNINYKKQANERTGTWIDARSTSGEPVPCMDASGGLSPSQGSRLNREGNHQRAVSKRNLRKRYFGRVPDNGEKEVENGL